MVEMEKLVLTIISNSGSARSFAMEAIQYAKKGEFSRSKQCIEDAEEKLAAAHKEQTKLIQAEAQGAKTNISLLLIHAQDHLMTAMTMKELALEIVDLHKKISEKAN